MSGLALARLASTAVRTSADGAAKSHRGPQADHGLRPPAGVHEIDLEVRPGEVVAILGANGAGKTTTMLALSGELPPPLGGGAARRDRHQGPAPRAGRARG